MSLILDALRKSEHQRQRDVGPGLAVVPESRASHRPAIWVLILAALLLLNILVLVALVLTDWRSDRVVVAPPAPSQAATPPVPPAEAGREQLRSAPVILPARPPRDEVRPLATEVVEPPGTPAPGPRPATPGATANAAGAAGPAPPAARAAEDARLPRFVDLVMRGELNLPHMHLDIHVFSATPAERFVFINMRRYNEGQATQEGPRVERITRDGVIMDYQGQRFLLSRD
jgi:general secretion pathway protein B